MPVLLAQSDAASAVQSALIAATVSLIIFVFGQLSTSRRDRLDRRYQRRRTALLDVQDAALGLRQRLSDYGELIRRYPLQRPLELAEAERSFDHARGLLEVTMSRVDDAEVVELVKSWRDKAQVTSISTEDDVPLAEEDRAWIALNAAIGRALVSESGTTGQNGNR